MTHLFRKPWSDKGHFESVGVRVKSVEGFWCHSSKHGKHSSSKLIAYCLTKKICKKLLKYHSVVLLCL